MLLYCVGVCKDTAAYRRSLTLQNRPVNHAARARAAALAASTTPLRAATLYQLVNAWAWGIKPTHYELDAGPKKEQIDEAALACRRMKPEYLR